MMVVGHVAAEKVTGHGKVGKEQGGASSGTRQGVTVVACGLGRYGGQHRGQRRGGWRGGSEATRRRGGRACGREERRLHGKGRQSAVRDLLAHEAPAAGQKRAHVAGREAAQLPTAGTSSSTGGGCADGRKARCRGEACGARGGRKERGPAVRGCGHGTGGEETSPSADETRSRSPCPLLRPNLAAPIAHRGGAGHQPLFHPSGGPSWCRSQAAAAFHHGCE